MTDLVCSYYTVAGVSPAAGGSSDRPFEERVRACAEAGYAGVGLHLRDYRALRASRASDEDLSAVLRDHGMRYVEVEFLQNWFADGAAGEAARRDEQTLLHMAQTFRARVLFLGGNLVEGASLPFEDLTERFAALCGRAAEHGVTIGLEPCAWSDIGRLDEALQLLHDAGAGNAGLYLDVWHLFRAGLDYDRLLEVDPGLIVGAQLGDAARQVQGSLVEDCLDHRLLPGEGDAGAARFVEVLDELGVTVPLSVEVMSGAQRGSPASEAARVSYDAARRVLGLARGCGEPGRAG